MAIRELSRDECLQVLAGARLARLACVKDNQPYIVPVYIAYARTPGGDPCLYGFTTEGQKVEWMRANPLVCVEVDDVASYDRWTSVIVSGRYEELPDTLGHDGDWLREYEGSRIDFEEGRETPRPSDERLRAYHVLQTQAVWWEPGSMAHVNPPQPGRLPPIYYRVNIDRITGHRANPDAPPVTLPATPQPEESWLRRLLRFVH